MADSTVTDAFEEHRRVLIGVAYRMLGQFADAEDVVQETWLRWSAADRDEVRDPRSYLVRITTRLAVDRLRQAQTRRESYLGPWLPEPVATEFGDAVPDTAERAVLTESVTVAMLVVLESLSPLERAVFVLREAFGFPYAEIAGMLDRTEAAVRQLSGRARRHVAERKPRYAVDVGEQRDLTRRFIEAATDGDLGALMEMLHPDVQLVADTGGKAKAPRRIIETADKVGRFIIGASRDRGGEAAPEYVFREVNGAPGSVRLVRGRPDTVIVLETAAGRIVRVYIMRNPDKLADVAV